MYYPLKIVKDIKKAQNKTIDSGPVAHQGGFCCLSEKSRPAGQTFFGISANSPPLQSGEPFIIF
jgi:hypothetical protein